MRVIIERPKADMLSKIREMHPELNFTAATEVIEYEVNWWQSIWWSFLWFHLLCSFCEWLYPSLKNEHPKEGKITIEL